VTAALYFDGSSARARPVQLRLEGAELVADAGAAENPGASQRWPLAEVQWPERTRHGQRVIHLRRGGSLQALDGAAFDAWRRAAGLRESWIVRAQQNWRATTAAACAVVVLAVAGSLWGVPLAARAVVSVLPATVDVAVGDTVMSQLNDGLLEPSALPAPRQAALRAAFAEAVAAAYPAGDAPRWRLHFCEADKRIGANAFALPGGHIVITDLLIERLAGHDDTVVGVLAHELGHLRHRDGMRGVVQLALLGTATSVVIGDFSSVLASAPALLGHLAYTRDAERAADAEAARVLKASGRSPAVMAVLFETLKPQPGVAGGFGIAFASHPMDEERQRFFRDAAAGR
jgi:predicted Zn-dependent protease